MTTGSFDVLQKVIITIVGGFTANQALTELTFFRRFTQVRQKQLL